jgi:hypothetical protein
MKTVTFEIEGRIDELLVVLDKDIQHMQDSLSRLNLTQIVTEATN